MAPARCTIHIDGLPIDCDADETILSAATRLGIEIPTLCFLEGRKQIESCGVCMVEVEGHSSFLPACASKVTQGMVIRTDTIALRKVRKTALELLFSDHLGDCLAPCERACPAHIDIPGFIREIKNGRPDKALALIQESIALTGVLGRVCPKFCERVCRRGEIDTAVPICSLKRFPADADLASEDPFRLTPKPSTGKGVAIVGGGIVGLTAAYYLALEGHGCTIYESRHRLGGALDEILPEFRLPKDVLSFEISRVLELGVQVETGKEIGNNLGLEELSDRYDAVLLAMGAAKEVFPDIDGKELALSGLDLLKGVAAGRTRQVEGTALVLGSGPTALDTSRTLLRLGASSVTLVMTPSMDSSLFFKTWIPDGLAEGLSLLDLCEEITIKPGDHSDYQCHFRRGGEAYQFAADHVYLASGVTTDIDLLQKLGLETGHQGVKVDRRTLETSQAGVFAAGNIAQAGRYAIQGSAAGRQVALSIHRYLTGERNFSKDEIDVRLPTLSEEEKKILFAGILAVKNTGEERSFPQLDPTDFSEVVPGFVNEEALSEAMRCLQCDCSAKKDCLLRMRGSEWEANPKAYSGERPVFERDRTHPDVVHEPGKCIKCGRCVVAARDHQESLGLTYIGRGFHVRIGVPLNHRIQEGLRVAARECVAVCPTGALSLKR